MPDQQPDSGTSYAPGDTPGPGQLGSDRLMLMGYLYRTAAFVRQHLENSALRTCGLSWTGFVVLWVVRNRGEAETRLVAEDAGISKGTLTGVAGTLESRGLLTRAEHPTDGRRVLLSLTDDGEALMARLRPVFEAEVAFVTAPLDDEECRDTAEALRRVAGQIQEYGPDRRCDDPRPGGRRPATGPRHG